MGRSHLSALLIAVCRDFPAGEEVQVLHVRALQRRTDQRPATATDHIPRFFATVPKPWVPTGDRRVTSSRRSQSLDTFGRRGARWDETMGTSLPDGWAARTGVKQLAESPANHARDPCQPCPQRNTGRRFACDATAIAGASNHDGRCVRLPIRAALVSALAGPDLSWPQASRTSWDDRFPQRNPQSKDNGCGNAIPPDSSWSRILTGKQES